MFSFLALEKIKTAEKLAKEIGSVLYGAVGKEAGMVTIMADLSKQGYGILNPKQHRDKLPLLRAAFEELVKKGLSPMAEIKIVHPDIRPGFDVTSNVLFRLDNEGKKASIKLIDFESIFFLRNWRAPLVDGRYIDKIADWDANTFVWWQCVCLAHSWHAELEESALVQGRQFQQLVQDFYGPRKISWLKELGVEATDNIDVDCVEQTLTKLGKLFDP